MYTYRKTTPEDLEHIWNGHIATNPDDKQYLRWKQQFIQDNLTGKAVTFAVFHEYTPIGEGTLLLNPDCRAIRGRTILCDGSHTANINALRIQKTYESQHHMTRLIQVMERHCKSAGIDTLTIGAEAKEIRNLAIYHHWGFTDLILTEQEDGETVLYFRKKLI